MAEQLVCHKTQENKNLCKLWLTWLVQVGPWIQKVLPKPSINVSEKILALCNKISGLILKIRTKYTTESQYMQTIT